MPATWPEPLPHGSYLLLTTFRRSGDPMPTPVWFAAEPQPGSPPALVAFTGVGAGKVKRLRHTRRVLVRGCTARGKPTGPEVEAVATLDEDLATGRAARAAVGRRHPVLMRAYLVAFRLFMKDEYAHPVGIRLTLPAG